MARDEKLEKLSRVPLFAGLGSREMERLGMLTDEIDLPAGRTLMRQGERGNELFLFLRGSARVMRDGHEIATRGPGEFVGEIALVDGGPRTATVTLNEDSTVVVVSRGAFAQLMEEFPDVRISVLEALAHRVRSAESHAAH